MASELRVNTLKDAAGNNSVGMSYVAEGSAKAWVTFDGTGLYGVNFSSAMSTANYSSVCNRASFAGTTAGGANACTVTAGSITKLQAYDSNGILGDRDNITAHVLGDLA